MLPTADLGDVELAEVDPRLEVCEISQCRYRRRGLGFGVGMQATTALADLVLGATALGLVAGRA